MAARITDKEIDHLSWIYERLASKHGENTNYDYMHKLNSIIINLKLDYAYGDNASVEKEPCTKEVYEICEYGDKQSNKVYDFEQGKELFRCFMSARGAHKYLKIETLEELFDSIIKDELLYVKSTKPIEWWEDAADYINTIDGEDKVEVEMFGKGLNKDQAQTAAMLMLDESHALEILENKYGADVIGKVAILLEQGE